MSAPGGWGSAGCPRSLAELLAGGGPGVWRSPCIAWAPPQRGPSLAPGPVDGALLRAARGVGGGNGAALVEKPSENPLVADFSQEGRRVACIMGSSGTLGDPKAVMLTEEGLVADALTGLAGYPYLSGARIVHLVPFEHAFGLTCGLNAAVAAGATICVPESPAAFLARLPRFAPTALNLPPRAAQLLLAAMGAADDPASVTGGALRKVLCGGAALGLDSAPRWSSASYARARRSRRRSWGSIPKGRSWRRPAWGRPVRARGCRCAPSGRAGGHGREGARGAARPRRGVSRDLGFSSFDMMMLCVRVEQGLGRPVDFGALVGVHTVDDLVRAVGGGR